MAVGSVLGVGVDAAAAQDAATDGGSYSDDDGSVHEPGLEALADRGVLVGMECGDGLICPDQPLKRWEMAVWLVRVLDSSDPDPVDASRFADVDTELWWAPFVDRLFALEVTVGCRTEPARFCPDRNVTRAQMATFLKRAFDLAPAPPTGFADVDPDGTHSANIDALAAAGITVGCKRDPLRYCPDRAVNRAQMATFLARALGEIPVTPPGQFVAVDVGRAHACGLRADSQVLCWGRNSEGQAEPPDGSFQAVTAGEEHSCGLRSDGTVTCWGSDTYGQTDAPEGQFKSLSAGAWHSCGVRADGTVACWGAGLQGDSDIPQGQFSEVSVGELSACALRTDSTVVCWGNNDEAQTDSPDGEFKAVTVAVWHSCGLRADQTVRCWGADSAGQANAPTGRYSSVAAGASRTCGVRADGGLACWGYHEAGLWAPAGEFVSVSVGGELACGVRPDQTVACWDAGPDDRAVAVDGRFQAVSVGEKHNCAVRADNTAVCWGNNSYGQAVAPEGEFSAVAAGAIQSCGLSLDGTIVCWGREATDHFAPPDGEFSALSAGGGQSCGLRSDGAVLCWGENGSGEADAPEGAFSQVGLGTWHSCAVRTDQAAVCWGNDSNGQADPPAGDFVAVAGGSWHSCGLRTDKSLLCWGAGGAGQLDVPAGEFEAVASGHRHSCAIRVDGAVVCWGANESGQADAPDGAFVAVDVGHRHSCGLRADDTVECWGFAAEVAPPVGVRRVAWTDQVDPGRCRPFGILDQVTAGFPLPSWAAPSVGTVRVAVLFVEFPDTVARHSTREEAELGLPLAEHYLEAASYGRLDIEFEPLHRWLRTENDSGHYLTERGGLEYAVTEEALRLADSDIDYTGYDLVMLVMPSSYFHGGNALGYLRTEEGFVSTLRVNVSRLEQSVSPTPWGDIAAHEIAHNLGLADLYPYGDDHADRAEPPFHKTWAEVAMGLMAMRVHFLADLDDPRLAHEWRYPDGYRSTAYRLHIQALEMLSWSRWQLGWLDASRVVCLADDRATVSLSPVAAPGDEPSMVAVPLSDHEALVIESRRKIGYDAGLDHREPDGTTTTLPALAAEGVLVYTVDASLATGELPLKIAGDTGNGLVDDYPVLAVGQSVTVRGYTVTVVADDGETHTVTIVKNGSA